MSKAMKHAAADIKAGFKNVPTMYKTLYKPNPGQTSAQHTKSMLKVIGTGRAHAGGQVTTPANRARLAVAGATSVTPLGPVTAFALGVRQSRENRATAKAAKAALPPKRMVAPAMGRPAPVAVKLPRTAAASPKPLVAPAFKPKPMAFKLKTK